MTNPNYLFEQSAVPIVSGARRWGVLEVAPSSTVGFTRWNSYRLEVFLPGTSPSERRLLLVSRGWIAKAIVVGVVAQIVVGALSGSTLIFALVFAGWATAVAITWWRARRLRARLMRLEATTITEPGSQRVFGPYELLRDSAIALDRLDSELRAGALSPVEYELGWSEVYSAVARSSAT